MCMETGKWFSIISWIFAAFLSLLLSYHFDQHIYFLFFFRVFVFFPMVIMKSKLLVVSVPSEIPNIFKKCLLLHDSFNTEIHLGRFTITVRFFIQRMGWFRIRIKSYFLLFSQSFSDSFILFPSTLLHVYHRLISLLELNQFKRFISVRPKIWTFENLLHYQTDVFWK